VLHDLVEAIVLISTAQSQHNTCSSSFIMAFLTFKCEQRFEDETRAMFFPKPRKSHECCVKVCQSCGSCTPPLVRTTPAFFCAPVAVSHHLTATATKHQGTLSNLKPQLQHGPFFVQNGFV